MPDSSPERHLTQDGHPVVKHSQPVLLPWSDARAFHDGSLHPDGDSLDSVLHAIPLV